MAGCDYFLSKQFYPRVLLQCYNASTRFFLSKNNRSRRLFLVKLASSQVRSRTYDVIEEQPQTKFQRNREKTQLGEWRGAIDLNDIVDVIGVKT